MTWAAPVETRSPGPWMRAVLSEMDQVPTAVRTFAGDWSGAELAPRAAGAAALGPARRPWDAGSGPSGDELLVDRGSALGGALADRPLAPLGVRLAVAELVPLVRALGTKVLVTDAPNFELASHTAVAAGVKAVLAGAPSAVEPDFAPTTPDSVVLVLHTSGTTGQPKTVRVRDAAMYHRSRAYRSGMGLSRGDLYCSTGGFHHTGGVGMLFVAAACGAGVVSFPRFSVDAWKAVAALRPTCALLVPTMIDLLLHENAVEVRRVEGTALRDRAHSPRHTGAALEVMPRTEFTQAYGMTEGGPISILSHQDHLRAAGGEPQLLASVGQVLPSVEFRFEEVSDDGVGELMARAGQIFQPDPDGWLRTGDLGRVDDEGFLYLHGRKGDKIIRGGENIFPLEIERVLELHGQVREAAVIGIASRRWGQTLKAVVAPVDLEHPPDVTALIQHARSRLAGFKVPEDWEFVVELPRNAAGKLLRHRLS